MNSSTKNQSTGLKFSFLKTGLILSGVFALALSLKDTSGYFLFLFLGGWLCWTFVEYAVHRFLLHELILPGKRDALFHHHEHHIDPHNIKVSFIHRTITLILGIGIIWLAIRLNSLFSVFAGFFTGFLLYSFLHYLLHQPYCRFILPRIQRAHILHHTTHPGQGYSFSTILWDWLFGTLPPPSVEISEKMKKFYFESDKKAAKILTNSYSLTRKIRSNFGNGEESLLKTPSDDSSSLPKI
jgi:hypothetical protein